MSNDINKLHVYKKKLKDDSYDPCIFLLRIVHVCRPTLKIYIYTGI